MIDPSGEADTDINAKKIDLAEAYIDMGDDDGAKEILNEVVEEGTPEQRAKAQEMLGGIADGSMAIRYWRQLRWCRV